MKKLTFCIAALAAAIASAQLSVGTNGFTYQGILLNGEGAPVEGMKPITFSIYNEFSGGSPLWVREITINAGADGLFNTELADSSGTVPAGAPTNTLRQVIAGRAGRQLYLGMKVDGSTGEIFPRQKMLPVPVAMHAEDAAGSSAEEFIVQGTVKAREVSTGEIEADLITAKNISVTGAINGIGTIPEGGIIMWSGNVSDIPTGWVLCNGQNGTPNLSGRFVLGECGSNTHKTGGSDSVTLKVNNLPPHTHELKVDAKGATGLKDDHSFSRPWNGNMETMKTESVGGGAPFNIMPPFYRLAYIMRRKTK